jgi:aryl-alcohol dehydrogenase-like predicted oxidoreductase
MQQFNRLYFGTWQLGGQFKKLSSPQIESLLFFALDSGINRFDTAAVYGEGLVEKILGLNLPGDSVIVTKIPATSKPSLDSPAPIQNFYSRDSIRRSAFASLERLQRSSVDTLLLHNWLPSWSLDAIEILESLVELKKEGIAKRVGISLPNNFSAHINKEILPFLDVIEAPFNPQNQWILSQLPELLRLKKEILLRSLFDQGKLLKNHPADAFLQKALELETSLVIGMTTEEQISQNIESMKDCLRKC